MLWLFMLKEVLKEGSEHQKKGCFVNFFFNIEKMSEYNSIDATYYQRKKDVILNRAKDYYENDKERLKKQASDKYRNLSEED